MSTNRPDPMRPYRSPEVPDAHGPPPPLERRFAPPGGAPHPAPDPLAAGRYKYLREPPSRGPLRRRPVGRRRIRIRRIVALGVGALLAWALISYAVTMLQPSNVSVGVRSVEWLRDNGFAWLVNDVESIYYSLNAPKKGGPALHALPRVGIGGGATAVGYQPPPVAPAITPALPGEGVWHRTGPLVAGGAPLLVTTFRPDPTYPRMVAGVAWIDRTRTRVQLYPGRYEPPSPLPHGPLEVPPAQRSSLVATFNSGFKLEDSGAGFVALGHVYRPLQPGLGTIVAGPDGSVDVRAWHGPAEPGPSVVFARQNLPLIVDGAQVNPSLSDGPQWGATLGNKVRVWRSAVGVDRHGNLLYGAADTQTVASLAQLMRRAGAVRAIELDINYEWVSFNTFGLRGAQKLMPGMDRPPDRYLTPDDRDFFAVYRRGR